jgi:hypothetical protein
MSTVRITIKTGNAAFTYHESHEVARILRDFADKLDRADLLITTIDEVALIDINGNKVGKVTVTGRRNTR